MTPIMSLFLIFGFPSLLLWFLALGLFLVSIDWGFYSDNCFRISSDETVDEESFELENVFFPTNQSDGDCISV